MDISKKTLIATNTSYSTSLNNDTKIQHTKLYNSTSIKFISFMLSTSLNRHFACACVSVGIEKLTKTLTRTLLLWRIFCSWLLNVAKLSNNLSVFLFINIYLYFCYFHIDILCSHGFAYLKWHLHICIQWFHRPWYFQQLFLVKQSTTTYWLLITTLITIIWVRNLWDNRVTTTAFFH